MPLWFNEFDKFAAQWLRNLWPDATVDERDIRDVKADDVVRYRRVHFFGGIGGWELALQLAGWPLDRDVWTGSCPCQPFSSAGKRKGIEDERHLWPAWFGLIRECRPNVIFGEQVESAIGHGWLDGVSADLEREGYAVGACVLGAHSVGAPHIRQRLYWVAVSEVDGAPNNEQARQLNSQWHSEVGRLPDADRQRSPAPSIEGQRSEERDAESCGIACGLADDAQHGCGQGSADRRRTHQGMGAEGHGLGFANSSWASAVPVDCKDGRTRRIEPSVFPLAPRLSRDLGRRFPELRGVAKRARANRVGRLRGYGNAIVPAVAATFIRAFMEATPTPTPTPAPA